MAIAAKGLSNNSDFLQLMALIDQSQGRSDKATTGLERAVTLDPRNPEALHDLALNYSSLRRYRDSERIWDRLIELKPEDPLIPVAKAQCVFNERADVKGYRAALDALPPSLKSDTQIVGLRFAVALCARDLAAAEEILNKSQYEEASGAALVPGVQVPRQILALWLELLRGNHPTVAKFGAAREQLYQKVEADRANPLLLMVLALADLALGHPNEGIAEGRRAMEMQPSTNYQSLAIGLAQVYAWADQPDLAIEQLNIVAKFPLLGLSYGSLKTHPCWDPLRKDPRFDKLLAELAPRE
jgi:tetratricopeptide (TPR) repeat protein